MTTSQQESDPADSLPGVSSVRAVDRACAVMCSFSPENPRLTLAELAAAVSLPKPTVYRIAATLVRNGFIFQAEDGRYSLGPRLMELGGMVRQSLDVVRACTSAVDDLAKRTGETILVAEPDWESGEILIVARRDSSHALSILSPVGRRSPVPTGCLGKALLSGLSEASRAEILSRLQLRKLTPKTHTARNDLLEELANIREVGFAVEQDEFVEGVSGVAVPVLSDGNRPAGAIGVVGPSTRLQAAELSRIGQILLDATRAL